jgi:amino acid permease
LSSGTSIDLCVTTRTNAGSPRGFVATPCRFWNSEINSAAWVTILIVFVIAINTFGIKAFGEVEFWLSLIKILTLTGLILLG